jgi:histidinol-phosphate/aromatic aminotransferase/cobyric acid decarboxylase-like protein
MQRSSFLSDDCPPMGIYETLYAFRDSFGKFMGSPGTHPWSQGFPLTTKLEGGPELPGSVEVTWEDRFYPKAWGHPLLREAIATHYNSFYGSRIAPENVMVFAGGRPGIYAVLAFLKKHVEVRIGNVEWPAYLDILTQTGCSWRVVPFTRENGFHPANATYFDRTGLNAKTHLLPVISNPGNPTGHTRAGAELEELMAMAEQPKNGILLDEAYEMFHASKGVSGIRYVKDLDNSNVFLAGACTKGLQCPGIRIGRSLLLSRRLAREVIKTPFQTVHADFPHTAYRRSLGFAALCDLRVLHGAAQTVQSQVDEVVPRPALHLTSTQVPPLAPHSQRSKTTPDVLVGLVEAPRRVPRAEVVAPASQQRIEVVDHLAEVRVASPSRRQLPHLLP